MTHAKSLRAFIDLLDEIGEVQRIDREVDWRLEIGAAVCRSAELRSPAPLFNNITDYRNSGFRVFGAPGARAHPAHPWARVAIALGLPPTATGRQLVDALAASRGRPGLQPMPVSTSEAPCMQRILTGDEIDLFAFPTPQRPPGVRSIGGHGIGIVRAPDGSWTSWSTILVTITGRDTVRCRASARGQLTTLRRQWEATGRPMPIAIALGVEPGLPWVAAMPLPAGVEACHVLGALFGQRIEVAAGRTVGLPVPATAEIVFEGHLHGDDAAAESGAPLTISAVSHRDGAIQPSAAYGEGTEEERMLVGIAGAAEILHLLRAVGLPVSTVWCAHDAGVPWLAIAMRPNWHAELNATLLAKAVTATIAQVPLQFSPIVLLVDDDVDVTELRELERVFIDRLRPEPTPRPVRPPRWSARDDDEPLVYNCLIADRRSGG